MRLTAPLAPRGLPMTPEDLGKALACVRRWNGGTIVPWSVLQHVVVCMGVAQLAPEPDPVVVLYAGMHDAEEIYTGDIPRPYKTPEQSAFGREVRAKIFESFGMPPAPADVWEIVKTIDNRVLATEQLMLTHPRFHPAGATMDLDIADMIWNARQVDPLISARFYGQALRECFESKEMRALKEMN